MITPAAQARLRTRYDALKDLEIALRTAVRIAMDLDMPQTQARLDQEVANCLQQQLCAHVAMYSPESGDGIGFDYGDLADPGRPGGGR